jgi:hypothetical protein
VRDPLLGLVGGLLRGCHLEVQVADVRGRRSQLLLDLVLARGVVVGKSRLDHCYDGDEHH